MTLAAYPNYAAQTIGTNFTGQVHKAFLVLADYTFVRTHDTVANVLAAGTEAAGTTRQTLASKTVTEEAVSGYLVNQADHSNGDTTVIVDTGSGSILPGDQFVFGSQTQVLTVTAYDSGTGEITYTPAVTTGVAENTAVNFQFAGHLLFDCANLVFTGISESQTVGGCIIYHEVDGTAANDRVMAFLDFTNIDFGSGVTGQVTVNIATPGFYYVRY